MKDAQILTDLARNKGVYLGCAPDTFFGNRWQTVRKLIDAGEIGTPQVFFRLLELTEQSVIILTLTFIMKMAVVH